MAQLIDLRDLLKHEILDLYSAEEQIIETLPKMIEKANNAELKKALKDHLKVTKEQKNRLDEIKGLMGEETNGQGSEEKKGFFSKLFGGSGGEKCKGTEGLIKEGEKMMSEDMTNEVMDAAIIGAAQKIKHYEISGYGTAVAYARELSLSNVAGLLQQTLDEEYAADDSLTSLAVGKLNVKAEDAGLVASKAASSTDRSKKSNNSKNNRSKIAPSNKAAKKAPAKGISSSTTRSKSATSSGNKIARKSVPKSSGTRSGTSSSKVSSTKSGKSKSTKRR